MKAQIKRLFNLCINYIETYTGHLYTYHMRPYYSDTIDIQSDSVHAPNSIAIVIQGRLVEEKDFTLETVRLYKKTFPHAHIIVSTQEGENQNYINQIKEEGIEVIVNKKPHQSGISHINYQITLTYAGIVRAKELGAEYILKTRTDIRMYAPNISEYLESLLHSFPVAHGFKQTYRIAVLSLMTFKYRLYGATDLTQFGHIDDMQRYWNVPYDTRDHMPPHTETIGGWAKARPCEVYLSTHFLEFIGRKLTYTLADSWHVYAEHFCIIDTESLDLYWHKYDRHKEYRYTTYDTINTAQELNFREWLILYKKYNNKSYIPEYSQDKTLGDTLLHI